MKIALLFVVTLVAQITFGWPGAPWWSASILLPMVFIVGPPLIQTERRWPHAAIAIGLAWDLVLEEVVGPGAIAWSATAVLIGVLVPLVADRSPRAWFAFGGIGALQMNVVRAAVRVPLGLSTDLAWQTLMISVLLTALWCGLVGFVLSLDLPQRLRAHRARKLR